MKRQSLYMYLLAAVFVIALALRLFMAFQSPNFEVGEAYFNYRQVESIKHSFLPTYFDDLSYSGRTRIFPPVYYYLLTPFALVFGTALTLKIVPNVLACLLIIIIYFMVFHITKNRNISLFSAAASGFIPVFFAETVNSSSMLCFTLPVIFYLIYCFMRIKEHKFLYHFLFFSFVLSLTSAMSFLFVFALLIYLMLIKLEYKIQNRIELEVILFITFLTLWVNAIIYKKAFLLHSYALIWQNIPIQVLSSYFREVDVVASVTNVGLLTLLLGVYAVYRYMFKERDKRTYLLMGFALAVTALLWFKLITLEVGLIFLGVILVPLMAQTLNLFFRYVDMTKIVHLKWAFWLPLVLLLLLTAVIPSIVKGSVSVSASVTEYEMAALVWVRDNTPEEATVLSTIGEGNLIASIAERRNVADEDFILIRSSHDVFDDVDRMYTAMFKSQAVELMNKYGVDYVYFSPRAKERFDIEELKYAEKDCFELVYDETVQVYRSFCEVKTG